MKIASDFNRSLAGIFCTPVFRKIAHLGMNDYALGKLRKYQNELSITPGQSIRDVLQTAYGYLTKNYRNEYIYKNTLLNNILLGRHSLRTATLLNEFRVGSSIADTVIINGCSTVYEIKTELDSPEKLDKQLADYRKAFVKIYLVTHHGLAAKYLDLLRDKKIGLLVLSNRFTLRVCQEAEEDFSFLDRNTMMRSMRKEEYSNVVRNYFGDVPEVPNIHFFKECQHLAAGIEPEILHHLMVKELRERKPKECAGLESNEIPAEIKHICHSINPNHDEYQNIRRFLNLNL